MPARLQTNTELPSPIQEFHVTLQFKNLGPGSVRLEVRPFYHLEIRRTNSAVWQEIGKTSLRLAQILRPGAASLRPIRIPADAAQFRIRRVRCRSWNTARQTAKGILQAFKIQFSPETFYTTDSPAWDLPAASIDLR